MRMAIGFKAYSQNEELLRTTSLLNSLQQANQTQSKKQPTTTKPTQFQG
jgi:hypothetical protein